MTSFHFLRPFWLLALVPTCLLLWGMVVQTLRSKAWRGVCDAHLLPFILETRHLGRRGLSKVLLVLSSLFLIISLAGPTWSRFPVPTYQHIEPRVVVLDLSDAMLAIDLTPSRLQRAKFKLHDLLQYHDVGQWGLVVYTGEPFVVSPLTDDGQTIDALLSTLTPDVMPVQGQQLSTALQQAEQLISDAGFHQGQLLVLTAVPPSDSAISEAASLSKHGLQTSIMPVIGHETASDPHFLALAKAGGGELIPMSDTSSDLDQWLKDTKGHHDVVEQEQKDVPVWRDEGRWFLIPALLFLLPLFRRNALLRIDL